MGLIRGILGVWTMAHTGILQDTMDATAQG